MTILRGFVALCETGLPKSHPRQQVEAAHKKAPRKPLGPAGPPSTVPDLSDQHLPPLMVFSVQLAADCTSLPAPRTVLQAASSSAPLMMATVVSFWIMFKSPGWRHRNADGPLRCHHAAEMFPMCGTPSSRTAYEPAIKSRQILLDCDGGGNMRVRIVSVEGEILGLVIEQSLPAVLEHQRGQRPRFPAQLQPRLIEVVGIKVHVTPGPHEGARLEPAFPGQHVGQQGIGGDVERHAEEEVGAALVELEVEALSTILGGRNLGLEQAMARGQRHLRQLARVPGGDDLAARSGVGADLFDQPGDLVDVPPVRCRPIAPLLAIDRAEIAMFVGPFVPDADLAFLQPADVGVAAKEPQKFDDDRSEVEFLGGQQRKSFGQVKPHLRPEQAERAGAGPVHLFDALVENLLHQVEIRSHRPTLAAVTVAARVQ